MRLGPPSVETRIRTVLLCVDLLCWGFSVLVTIWALAEYDLTQTLAAGPLTLAATAMLLHLIMRSVSGASFVSHTRGSFEEVCGVADSALLTTVLLLCSLLLLHPEGIPLAVPIFAGAIALVLMLAVRFVQRARRTSAQEASSEDTGVIIVGAGSSGRMMASAMLRDSGTRFRPVAFVDDDPAKCDLFVDGIPVRGSRRNLPAVVQHYEVTHVVVAIPSAPADLLREVHDLGQETGLTVKVLPSLKQLLDAPEFDPASDL